MTFLEAALEVLRREGRPLHYKELTDLAMQRKLLTFVGRTPEVTMQTQLTNAVKKAPGNPFVRTKPGVFGLLRYPPPSELKEEEETASERETAAAGEPAAEQGGRSRRRRRRGGRGRGRSPAEIQREETGESLESTEPEEPEVGAMSAEARAAALAETGVLDAGEESEQGMDSEESEERPLAADEVDAEQEPSDAEQGGEEPAAYADLEGEGDRDLGQGDLLEEEGTGAPVEAAPSGEPEGEGEGDLEGEGEGEAAEATEGGEIAAPEGGEEAMGGRRRRRRRRRRRGGEGPQVGAGFGGAEAQAMPAAAPSTIVEAGEPSGAVAPSAAPVVGEAAREAAAPAEPSPESQVRRIMTPIDAAIEILRTQPPGRAMHVRQIADTAARRRLVHGEPNEAWRVLRAALAAEGKERTRGGMRPRVRAAGSGLYALARRPPDAELERAEQVFGEARRALRERTVAALERRIADLPPAAFEALARVLMQREGFGPATFVKRVEGVVYLEALRGRGMRPSRCLVALRATGAAAGRRAIGELRAGIRARNQDEGLLMLGGRLADDAIAEWKQSGAPVEIADGPALAETCIRHGVGVIGATVNVDFVDADFFSELAEG